MDTVFFLQRAWPFQNKFLQVTSAQGTQSTAESGIPVSTQEGRRKESYARCWFSNFITPSQWWPLAWPFHLLTAGWFLPWSDFISHSPREPPFVPLFPVPLQYTLPEGWVFSDFCGNLSSRGQPKAKASTLPDTPDLLDDVRYTQS